MNKRRINVHHLRAVGLGLLSVPYLAYLAFVIRLNQGPVDYETFMGIGREFLRGGQVYGENSYYPLPYVTVFAVFSLLPKFLSLTLWLLLPVVVALLISGWRPYVLLFAPVFSHFVGGQTSVFGLLGLWGFHRHSRPDQVLGGVWLSLTLLKPQLGIVPLAYAIGQWWRYWRLHRRVPAQVWGFAMATGALYAPSFIIWPDWPVQWLSRPRPLFERAMSGLIPRALLPVADSASLTYWAIWLVVSGMLLCGVWLACRRKLSLTPLMLWSFIASPLVHDYDLIQLVPLLDTPAMRWGAVLLSLPGWVTILSAYGQDNAWFVFAFIGPGLLGIWLYENRKSATPVPSGTLAQPAIGRVS